MGRKPLKMRKIPTSRGRRRGLNVVMPPTLKYRSTNGGRSGTKRACSRLRMRPWLEGLLDRSECSILKWADRDKKTFSIMWRHASSLGFNQSQHGDLFYMWAHHTGKLLTSNQGNHSINKSTFRCALHSLKDCIELTKTGDKRGEGAKRTYQFIDPGHRLYDRKRKRAFQSRRQITLRDESSRDSGLDFMTQSADDMAYPSPESDSQTVSYSPSSAVANLILESLSSPSTSNSNDFTIHTALSTSPELTTSSIYFTNSYAPDDNDEENNLPNCDNIIISTDVHYTGAEQNDVIPSVLPNVDLIEENEVAVNCKQEPMTPNNHQSEEIKDADHQDSYQAPQDICHPKLNCGGNVKVQINSEESQPQKIDCTIIQALLEQRQLKFGPALPVLTELFNVNCNSDLNLGYTELIEEEPPMEDNVFLENQTQDNEKQVLTELQPCINDSALTAMEMESSFYINAIWNQDIFADGTC